MGKICTLVPRLWLNTNAVGRSCCGTVLRWFVVLSVASSQDENVQEPHPWDGILGTLFWRCFDISTWTYLFILFHFIFVLLFILFYLVLHSPGGTPLMLITGRLRAELQPLPFYVQKRYHFRIRSIDKWYPFHIPSHTPRYIPCYYKCTVF